MLRNTQIVRTARRPTGGPVSRKMLTWQTSVDLVLLIGLAALLAAQPPPQYIVVMLGVIDGVRRMRPSRSRKATNGSR